MTEVAVTPTTDLSEAEITAAILAARENNVRLSTDALSSVESIEDAFAVAGVVNEITDYGHGFAPVEKSTLEGVEFLAIEWSFLEGDYGSEYVFVIGITRDGRKFLFTDGGSGMVAQFRRITARRVVAGHPNPFRGLQVPRGLRASEYATIADPKHPDNGKPAPKDYTGKVSSSTTYYLAE